MVDIIIPIVNSNSDLRNCLKCIYAHSVDVNIYIAVNKGLDRFVENHLFENSPGIVFRIESDQYLSFYQLANLGLMQSQNDIVLLDPSICVTSNWLAKLIECAYSYRTIGTVTPFCNNGNICSIPKFMENNDMDQFGLPVEDIAKIIETFSKKEYPILPRAVGYCLYIKRETINYVGIFEANSFGYGFGEDVEYSWRSNQFGYTHVLCDNTFVFCMDDSLLETYKKHIGISKIHLEQYSKEIKYNNNYIIMNPLSDMQKMIHVKLISMNGKKNIFINLHFGFEPENLNNMGGTQFLVKDIVYGLKYKYNFFVFFLDHLGATLNVYCDQKIYSINYKFNNQFRAVDFSNRKVHEILFGIFSQIDIDFVHIHHTIAQTFDIAYVAMKFDVPYIVSLHDYYWICPSFNLISYRSEFCYGVLSSDYCGTCLSSKLNLKENIIDIWRDRSLEILSMSKSLVVPSNSTMEIYARVYPELAGKFNLISHGIRRKGKLHKTAFEKDNINIAFVGSLTREKGSDIAYKLINHECSNLYNWFFFGDIHDNRFFTVDKENVTLYGIYHREDLQKLLGENNINIVCVLSTVPETFCFVLSEVLEAGIPVIASDIGALSERINDSRGGWLIPSDSEPEVICNILQEIRNDPSKYYNIQEELSNYHGQYLEDMTRDYSSLYDNWLQ